VLNPGKVLDGGAEHDRPPADSVPACERAPAGVP
jgi:hypothetical protein